MGKEIMLQAVAVLIPSCHTKYSYCKFLAVPRRNDPTKVGLPGGKVDGNESLQEAIKRECFEETQVELLDFIEIYSCEEPGEVHYFTTTFLARSYKLPKELKGDSGTPFFTDADHLVSKETSAFPDYNKNLFDKLKEMNISDDFYMIL
jgi:ADP-ribose pyrophosphatase YjhB (NUDIX family)